MPPFSTTKIRAVSPRGAVTKTGAASGTSICSRLNVIPAGGAPGAGAGGVKTVWVDEQLAAAGLSASPLPSPHAASSGTNTMQQILIALLIEPSVTGIWGISLLRVEDTDAPSFGHDGRNV